MYLYDNNITSVQVISLYAVHSRLLLFVVLIFWLLF